MYGNSAVTVAIIVRSLPVQIFISYTKVTLKLEAARDVMFISTLYVA